MNRHRIVMLLPWLLCAVILTGSATREAVWRKRQEKWLSGQQRLHGISAYLRKVHRASNAAEEETALIELWSWAVSKDMGISLAAFDRQTGQPLNMHDIVGTGDANTTFELGFDLDGDHRPIDYYLELGLKDPANIEVLMT